MRVGVSLRSGYGDRDPREAARWMIDRARAAREASLDSLFVGDGHVTSDTYFQNSPILGRLLAEWGDAPAGALYLLPLWHPVVVAEQVATLAAVAEGRFILQCAIGDGGEQFAGMGVERRHRVSRFEESLGIVRRLLAGEEVSSSRAWSIERARIGPIPDLPVEVWVGGAVPAALDRAARLGDAWVAGPYAPSDELAPQVALYRQACEQHGKRPTVMVVRRDIHVGRDDADAHRVADPVIAAGYRGLNPAVLIVGGPDRVAGEFRRLAKMGFTDVLIRHLADEQRDVLDSFERMADVRLAVADA